MLTPIYLNGRWFDQPVGLPLNDPGVTAGAIVVETIRTRPTPGGRELFEPDRHWPRLDAGLAYLGLDRFPGEASPRELCDELLRRLPPGPSVAVVLLVTPGPTVVCHARPLPDYSPLHAGGVELQVSDVRQGVSLPRAFKHRSRLHWWKAAHQAGPAMAWLPDDDGVLTETAVGNVIGVRGRTLVHAPAGRVVPGVTAAIVSELAASIGWECVEEPTTEQSLGDCDEWWLTSTGCCVAPVSRIGDRLFPQRARYERLVAEWADRFGDFREWA